MSHLLSSFRMQLLASAVIAILAISSAHASTQYLATTDVTSSNGFEVKAGTVVNVLGVNDVSNQIAASGRLLTFQVGNKIYTADAGLFEQVKDDANIGTTALSFEPVGNSSRLCTTLYDRDQGYYLSPITENLDSYFRVTAGGQPVSYSIKTPTLKIDKNAHNFATLRSNETSLCFEGLDYSTSYKLSVLPGLKMKACSAANCQSYSLDRPVSVWGSTRDRASAVELSTGKTILPIDQKAKIRVTVTNIKSLNIEVFKVDLRSLTNARSLFKTLDGYDLRNIKSQYAVSVGQYSLPVSTEKNKAEPVNIDLSNLIPRDGTGIYVAVFNSAELNLNEYDSYPTQWLIRSNVSVSSYHGLNTTEVLLTTFDQLKEVAGAQVQVIATNNRVLFDGASDAAGRVSIPNELLRGEGGHAPRFLLAQNKAEGIALLEFNVEGGDLNTGTQGVEKSDNRDIYLTTDRELYRGGDSIRYLIIGRDETLSPLSNTDLKVELIDPSQKVISNDVITADQFGLGAHEISLNASARLGRYVLKVSAMDDIVLAQRVIQVEDFVPLTIKTTLVVPEQWIPDEAQSYVLSAEYFSGGAAAKLKAEVVSSLKRSDTHQDPKWSGYQFGAASVPSTQYLNSSDVLSLDSEGIYRGSLTVSQSLLTESGLYTLLLKGSTFDVGGRPNISTQMSMIDHEQAYLGISSQFEGTLQEGQNPLFKLTNINRSGDELPINVVKYELHEVGYSFDWFYDNGWRFRKKRESDSVLSAGTTKHNTLEISTHLQWGNYELVAINEGGFKTVVPFTVGWYGGAPITEPSQLAISFQKTTDDQLAVKLDAPFAGTLRIMTATADINSYKTRTVTEGDNTFTLPLDEISEPGFHVLATLVRPIARGTEHLPQIAVGSGWVPMLSADRRLTLQIAAKEKQHSDEPIHVRIKVDRLIAKGKIFLVDEGIHVITGFKNSDPREHFFGPRKLSIGFLSNFGQLVEQDDSLKAVGVGGDEGTSTENVAKSEFFKTVAAASPLLDTENGILEYTFPEPAFEGQLRVVVMVVDERGVGFEEASITVQDPVSMDVSLPRFVGAGDQLSGKLALRFNESVGQLNLKQTIGQNSTTTTLAGKASGVPVQQNLNLKNLQTGKVPVNVSLDYQDTQIARDFSIVVRDSSYPLTQMQSMKLEKTGGSGNRFDIDPLNLSAFGNPENAKVIWSLSPLPGASMSHIVASLDRYPYGCIEQTSSGTRGMLAVAEFQGKQVSDSVRKKINHGVDRILAKQKSNGAFGYWDRNGRIESRYLAYATDTLIQALRFSDNKKVVKDSIAQALQFLDRQYFDDVWTALYSYGVLAKSGYEVTSRARYAIDEQLKIAVKNADSTGERLDLLAAGYWLAVMIHDDNRAVDIAESIDVLLKSTERLSRSGRFAPSGDWFSPTLPDGNSSTWSGWRVESGIMLAALPKANRLPAINELISYAMLQLTTHAYRSTFDNANLAALLAAKVGELDQLNVQISGKQADSSEPLSIDLAKSGFVFSHSGDTDLFFNAEIVGRRQTVTAVDNGFRVNKFWFDKNGQVISNNSGPLEVKKGDVLTVVVTFEASNTLGSGSLMLTDLLPSGFEIESTPGFFPEFLDKPLILSDSIKLNKNQIGSPVWTQSMDDRFTANYTDYWRKHRKTLVYYQVRATYTGNMQLPDAHVELMYRPEINGRSTSGRGQISAK
ncbi:MG2 domain-containing protein [Neptunomonas sp.]|uniref:alpha-2-macroglobulin family protein n=1 Tax=Neptunomonas sp. TaxID=1971898 RepID=UPI0025EBCE60|nr:MG2 domain-containing protein [Neptunomonas sp.]